MQDPDEAARELTRCAIELGFAGAQGIPADLRRIDHRNDWMKAPHK